MKVLFVCTGNTCRSPMAEAIARKLAAELGRADVQFSSAGIIAHNGCSASNEARAAVRRWGADLSAHESRAVTEHLMAETDLVLTMTKAHEERLKALMPEYRQKVFQLAEYVGGREDIIDPYGGSMEEYLLCASEIVGYVGRLMDKLKEKELE